MYTRKQKLAAKLACMAIIIVALSSMFFLVKEANHTCTEPECPVCACLHEAEETIRNIGTGAIRIMVSIFAPVTVLFLCLEKLPASISNHSLITQKVRLND